MRPATALLLSALAAATPLQADPRVAVFTDRRHPVTHAAALPQATVYRIDGLVRAQAALSAGLPRDPEAAARIATARLAERGELREEMREAGEGLALAHLQYRIDRYPAIVFDGAAVIYGVTDLAVARRLHAAQR